MANTVKKGRLHVGYGPMFSGKTSWLINEYGDGSDAVAFKPDIDKRYTARPVLRSHNEQESPAILLSLAELGVLVNETVRSKRVGLKKVLIDEINFFPDTIIDMVEDILSRGIDVYAAGLLTDSDRNDFGPTRRLMALADTTNEYFSRCDYVGCEQPACYTYAKKKKETQVIVGATDMYGAACEQHYDALQGGGIKDRLDYSELVKHGVYPGFIDWLSEMDMPYIRRSLPIEAGRQPHIEVGGDSMRIGKTTALTVLKEMLHARGFRLAASVEDWRHNPFVQESYGDSSDVILRSQEWFAKRKLEQLQQAKPHETHIQDVHPEMDFCYALVNALMGRLSLRQFEHYVEYYYSLPWQDIAAPDLLVYLTASDPVLIERAQQAAREFETIDERYFLIMKAVNRKWLEGARKRYRVLEINTDNFDFASEQAAREQLAEMVLAELARLGWPMQPEGDEWGTLVNGSWEEVLAKKLVVLSGLPGSGKSYWAHKLKKHEGYSYLSSDVIRLSKVYKNKAKYLDTVEDYVETRELTYTLLHEAMLKRLKTGKKVVIDATYLGPQREMLLSVLKHQGLLNETVFLVVKTDENVVSKRVLGIKKSNGEADYENRWQRAYEWFAKRLATGEVRYPDETLDGVRVVEVWNN